MTRSTSRPRRSLVATVTGALVAATVVVPAAGAVTAAPAMAAVSSGVAAKSTSSTARWVAYNKTRVTARPSWSSRTVARPDDGTRLRVLDRGTYKLKVRVAGGKVGWVSKKAITSTPLYNVKGTRYTTGRVALTKTSSGSSKVVKHVRLGTKVTRVARTSGRHVNRVKVRVAGGGTGWVSAKKLTTRNVWGKLANCESGGNPRTSTGNGYYGLYQFTARTWRSVGGHGLPHHHSRTEQTKRAQILQERAGWGQWPSCTRKLGLR